VQPVADVTSQRRFLKILQSLHVNDNSQEPKKGSDNYDKLYKLRPLIERLNEQFQFHAVSSSSQSVDEAMVLFKGHSSFKQYMPLKPTKRGHKIWIRADAVTGYVYQMEVYMYTGKDNSGKAGVGLGARVVNSLTHALDGSGTHITFDNFFSTYSMMEQLYKRQIFVTCTVRCSLRTSNDTCTVLIMPC